MSLITNNELKILNHPLLYRRWFFLKTIFIFLVTALVYVFLGNNFNQEIIIPKESIRFRIIADDNTEASEEIKFKIKMLIELELSEI